MTTRALPRPAELSRARKGFAGYDWANSGYVTVVTTAVGGPYLDALARSGGTVHLLGLAIVPSLVLPATLIAAVLVQLALLPLLGRMVDRGASPATLVRRLALLGGTSSLVLALAPSWPVAALATAVATICFGAGMVPYNALLPRLAPGVEADRLSARAFAAGYVGGGLLLAAALGLLTVAPLGLGKGTLVRIAIAAAGLWWAGFAWLACRAMSEAPSTVPDERPADDGTTSPQVGMLRLLRDLPQLRRTLIGSLLLGDAIGAVVALSATVLTFELWTSQGKPASDATGTLLLIVLLIQVIAAPAALAVGVLASRLGTKPVLLACLGGWVIVLANAATGLRDITDAYVLAVGVALVLGGSQTLSRSLVFQCTPADHAGAVAAANQLGERSTAFIGPTLFAVVVGTTGSYRGALASLLVLFVVAALVLAGVRPARGVAGAAAYDPVAVYEARRLALPDATAPTTTGRLAYAVVVTALGVVSRVLTRLRVDGPALPEGGVVVLANHRSVTDGPLLAVVSRRRGRQLRMLGTAGVFTAPLLGPLLLKAGMVPVKRRTDRAGDALTGARTLLAGGEAVGLFPEGRIGHEGDGLPTPLRHGAARLALTTGVPVVLVGVWGADQVVRPGSRRLSVRALVRVAVSEPVELGAALGLAHGPTADPDDDVVAAATDLLHDLLTAQVLLASGRVHGTDRAAIRLGQPRGSI